MRESCWAISGRVQRVGFRYWTVKQAAKIGGLSGYVMNHPNGDVLVKAVGEDDKVNQLFALMQKGPLFARVDSIREDISLNTLFPEVNHGVFQRLN